MLAGVTVVLLAPRPVARAARPARRPGAGGAVRPAAAPRPGQPGRGPVRGGPAQHHRRRPAAQRARPCRPSAASTGPSPTSTPPNAEACSGRASPPSTSRRAGPRTPTWSSRSAPRLVLVAGGLQVRGGALTTGGLLVVLGYLRDLYSPVRALTRLSGVWARAGRERGPGPRRAATPSRRGRTRADAVAGAAAARAGPAARGELRLRAGAARVLADLDLHGRARRDRLPLRPERGRQEHRAAAAAAALGPRLRVDRSSTATDLRTWTRQSVRERIAYVPAGPLAARRDARPERRLRLADRDPGPGPRGVRADPGRRVRRPAAARPRHPARRGRRAALRRPATTRRPGPGRRVPAELVLLDEPTASLDARSRRARRRGGPGDRRVSAPPSWSRTTRRWRSSPTASCTSPRARWHRPVPPSAPTPGRR